MTEVFSEAHGSGLEVATMDAGPYISPPLRGSKLSSIVSRTLPNPSAGTHILVISLGYQSPLVRTNLFYLAP